jgi:hypothetical protein
MPDVPTGDVVVLAGVDAAGKVRLLKVESDGSLPGGGGGAPDAHAASHQHGGSDQVATATPGANAIPKANGSGDLDIGWINLPRLSAPISADQVITPANTIVDLTGASVSLAAGTWLVFAQFAFLSGALTTTFYGFITDGANAIASSTVASASAGGLAVAVGCSAVVTPGGTTTYKLRALASAGTDHTALLDLNDGVDLTKITAVRLA